MIKWTTIATALTGVLLAGLVTAPVSAGLPGQDSNPGRLQWGPCQFEGLARYQCAVAQVPVDHGRPDGESLGLALVRQPATDPANRIGTLFLGVGGPGGSGVESAKDGPLASGEVARRFDVVTFDQRGVGRSGQVRCFGSVAEQERFWLGTVVPPANSGEERLAERNSREHARGCGEHGGELLANLSTVDAARDLELLREAVGDPKLTYAGGSYASYLGQVYGAMFPDRVRALQLSAMIDPEGYTNHTTRTLLERSTGTELVLSEFGRLCDEAGQARCAAAGDARARSVRVLDRLKRGPITVGSGASAISVQYRDVVPLQANLLYDTQQGWPALGSMIVELERGAAGDPAVLEAILGAGAFRLDFLDSFTAISCADHRLPKNPGIWPAVDPAFDARSPHYGSSWWYVVQACASWPVEYPQRYTGPWRLRSETPALLINNRFDPVTPLTHAEKARDLMGNAQLLVVEGHGHAPVSACVEEARERYLVELRLPDPATRCVADRAPFSS